MRHYGKVFWQVFNKPWLGQETFQYNDYFGSGEVVRKTQYDDATVLFRRVLPDVGKVQVSCQQRISGLTGALCDLSIRSGAEPDVSGKLDGMSARRKGADRRPRHVGVEQETHAGLDGG